MEGIVIVRSAVEERMFQTEADAAKWFLELLRNNEREISVYKLRNGSEMVPMKELHF